MFCGRIRSLTTENTEPAQSSQRNAAIGNWATTSQSVQPGNSIEETNPVAAVILSASGEDARRISASLASTACIPGSFRWQRKSGRGRNVIRGAVSGPRAGLADDLDAQRM